jgi:lactaldehyde dehydrogenase / glycolaldehyde dehydrogenase
VITGDGRTVGAHLVSHKDTDLVSMTGSVRAGGEIYALGAKLIKPIRLELGGKAPFIVMEDADIDKFLAKVKTLKVGDPTEPGSDIGPRISGGSGQAQADRGPRPRAEGDPAHRRQADGPAVRARTLVLSHRLFREVERPRDHERGDLRPGHRRDGGERLRSGARLRQRLRLRPVGLCLTRDNRRIMRCVNELSFGEIYVNRPSGESPHGFHTGYRRSGLGGEDGQHGIEGFMRKKTMYNNFA